jgi:tripeptide aminopeptidase
VLELFLELAALRSPPGEEREVADVVSAYVRDLGFDVEEDEAGAEVASTIGNLYTRLEPTADGVPIFLCAHLDTVPPDGPLEPVVDDGVVRNAGGTILGADDKAAVAVMLAATRRVLGENRPHAGIELLFTPKEEVGLLGAAAFDHTRLHAQVGYVYDQAAPIGEIVLGAP